MRRKRRWMRRNEKDEMEEKDEKEEWGEEEREIWWNGRRDGEVSW